MCRWLAILVVLTNVGAAPPTMEEARVRLLKGNYAEARDAFTELAKVAEHRAAAAIGLSQASQAEGHHEKAHEIIDAAVKSAATPDLLARQAELLYLRGDWDDADRAISECLKLQDDHFLGRWIRATLLRDRGQYDAADVEYRWFVRTYVARNRARQDIKDPEQLVIVGLAGSENARWHRLADQFKFILNEVYGDALKADANYWPAEFQAGMLLLEKYNKKEALAAFDKALSINPRAADALVGKGRLSLQHFELYEAESLARRALELNAKHVGALMLLADVAWAAGELKVYETLLTQARSINPRNESLLARLAALDLLRSSTDLPEPPLAKEIAAWNPKPGRFYFELASKLDERRHFELARRYYQKALELFPQLSAARTELGLLAMRLGDEETAKPILDDAFKADPFHIRLDNSRRVLKHLEKYTTVRTEHFIIRFDAKHSPILGRMLPDFLEAEYEQLAKQFDYRPTGPFVFELFNSHEMFSGRIIAAKDLHTIGATTGRVFALAGPRAKGVGKPYNWARVIRHELTHIFNLDQTRFLVPHWLTEGLAVANEGFERPAEWLRVLAARTERNELFTLENIDAALTRPKSHDDWTLAYCQAQLYIEFLKSRIGLPVFHQLLNAYRERLDTAGAIQRACQTGVPALESEYKSFVSKVIKESGAQSGDRGFTLAQLEVARSKTPDDLNVLARLADEYQKRKRTADAWASVTTVLEKDPRHAMALFVKAQLLLDAGDEIAAQEILESATREEHPFPKSFHVLGKIYQQAAKYEEAMLAFERGRASQPAEPRWLEEIARTARLLGDTNKAITAIQDWLRSEPDELEQRRELARLAIDAEKFTIAERAAREAIEIDPADNESQELLLTALTKQGKASELAKWGKYFQGNHK